MSIRILLIEDNPDHILVTKRILQSADQAYEVDAVREGQEALKKILQDKQVYDLVLCDFRLPDINAIDVLRRLREKGKDIAFVVVTSAGSEKIAVELMKQGAYDYVVKDLSYDDELPMIIKRAIDRYRVKKEKEALEEQLREYNKKLKHMYEVKSNFTSVVSHELRTPLTAIKEGISIVLDGLAGEINKEQTEFLALAKNNVDRLKRLIDDVLDFSKLESKKIQLNMRQAQINQLIEEVAQSHAAVAKEKGLFIKTELDPRLPLVQFDADRMSQVLSNLINNAIKFTSRGGLTIKSSQDARQNSVEVCVVDTGGGIRKEDLGMLFKEFQQLAGITNRQTGGTGLGLAICKEIIERHRGRIWVESEYEKGSQFKFSLPIKLVYKVLVIDDDKEVLDTCEAILKKDGFVVSRSLSGMEGVGLAQHQKPDVIVVDMRLKDISGYEVLGRLRSNKDTCDISVLAMSGYTDEIEKIQSHQDTLALPWIVKPFDKDEFLLKIKTLLR